MSDEYKNLLIGIFVVVALGIVVFILLYLHPSVGDEKQVVYAWFTDIDKVNVGTRVTFAGKPVGEVGEIILRDVDRTGPTDSAGHLYIYKLQLLLDSHVRVYDTDEITLRTSGLLGERSVSIMPMPPQPGQEPRLLTKKDVIYAIESGSVEETMREFRTVAENLKETLNGITGTLDDVKKQEIVHKLGFALDNIGEVAHAINKPEELSGILDDVYDLSSTINERINPTWNLIDDSFMDFKKTMEKANDVASDARSLMQDVKEGKGSLGGLLVRDDLYLQMKSVFSKAETVANDINHYGLLFHSNKGWQRLRARRMNLLEKLSSPQEFRNYFNDEMDQITTSLSRVYMILQETELCGCPSYAIGADPDFRKVFAELLRRSEELEEGLKAYNQQLMEAEVRQTEFAPPCCY